jgi:CelD/BcsL family acetyltransferase involved in cellulose biosynthesis
MVTIKIIRSDEEFENLKEEWNSLLERSKSKSIFLTWEWLFNWWKIYKKEGDKELFIVTILEEENDNDEKSRLIGIAPLMIENYSFLHFLNIRQIEFLGTGEVCSDFLDFIILQGREDLVIQKIFDFLKDEVQEWDFLELTDIPEDSKNVLHIEKKAKENKFSFKKDILTICPYIKLPSTIKEHGETLDGKTRREMRRYARKLDREFYVKFKRIEEKEKLEDALDEMITLSKSRWNSRGLNGAFSSERMVRFHKTITEQFLENNWLNFVFLNIDGTNAAYAYNFQYDRKMFGYSIGFDPNALPSKYRVGTVLANYCIEQAILNDYREFYLGRGDDPYKRKYTKLSKKNLRLRIGRNSLKTNAFSLILEGAFIVKKILFRVLPERYVNKLKETFSNSGFKIFR